MKSPCALCGRGLAEKEERVDEIECKVFIKCGDGNLLWICGELVFRDGLCSEAMTRRRGLWSLLWSSSRRRLAAVGQTLNGLSRGREKGSNQSSLWLCSRKRPISAQSNASLAGKGGKKTKYYSNTQAGTLEMHFIIVSSAVSLLVLHKSYFKNHDFQDVWNWKLLYFR